MKHGRILSTILSVLMAGNLAVQTLPASAMNLPNKPQQELTEFTLVGDINESS